jgi:WD40 repeat protein
MPDSPYVGLTNYTEEQAGLFVGREAERKTIIGNLRASRLTLLYAESGVGKSSLLRAGVASRLLELADRSLAERGSARYVPVVFSSWSDEPVQALIDAIAKAIEPFLPTASYTELPRAGLPDAIEAATGALNSSLLIILDQFEEYFLYRSKETSRATFAEQLARCINRTDLRANFLISIREDAYAGVGDLFKERIANVYGNYLHIDYLDRNAARDAIKKPIELFNRLREESEPFAIEPELAEAVLDQVQRDPSDGALDGRPRGEDEKPIETTYLQLVMKRLWDEERARGSRILRLETLVDLGGPETIIRTHVDTAMAELPVAEQSAAATFVRFLVTATGTKIAWTAEDLADFSGVPKSEVEPVLRRLAAGELHILRPIASPESGKEPRYEIFHDALARPLLDWRRRHYANELERKRAEAEDRARRERRKARLAAAAAGAFLLLAAFAVGVSIWAVHQKHVAESERQLARSRALLAAASDQLDTRLDRAIGLGLQAYDARPSAETRSGLVTAVERSDRLQRIVVADSEVGSVALSLDGSKLAIVEQDGAVIANAAGRRLGKVRVRQAQKAAFTPDGGLVAVGGRGRVVLWDVAGRRSRGSFVTGTGSLRGLVTALAFAADGRRLVAVTKSRAMAWDLGTRKRVLSVAVPTLRFADHVDVSSDGALVAYTQPLGGFAVTRVLPSGTAKLVRSFGGGRVAALAFAPGGRRLGAITLNGQLRMVDVFGSAGPATLVGSNGSKPTAIALGPRPRQVAVGWENGNVEAWRDVNDGAGTPLHGHGDAIGGLAFSEDGNALASGGADGLAEIWSPWRSSLALQLAGDSDLLSYVGFAGPVLVASSDLGGGAFVWRSLRERPDRLATRVGAGTLAAVSPDHRRLSVATARGSVVIYDLDTSKHRVVRPRGPSVTALAFGPDSTLAAAAADGSVSIWSLKRLRQVGRLHIEGVHRLSFDSKGTLLAVAAHDGVSIWNLKTQRLESTPIRRPDAIAVAFSPDGRLLAAARANGSVELWDVSHDRVVAELSAEGSNPQALAFSPDGATLAVGAQHGLPGSVSLWDVESRQRLGEAFDDRSGGVSSVDFSNDGRFLALADGSGKVTVLRNLLWSDARGMRRRLCSVLGGADRTCG